MKPSGYCRKMGKTSSDFISLMREAFPKYCHAAHSMANHAEEYGLSLSPSAKRFLKSKMPPPRPRAPRPRSLPSPLPDAHSAFFDAVRAKRGQTFDQAMEEAILLYIEKAAEAAPNSPDGTE